jgi:hypothetical protein
MDMGIDMTITRAEPIRFQFPFVGVGVPMWIPGVLLLRRDSSELLPRA